MRWLAAVLIHVSAIKAIEKLLIQKRFEDAFGREHMRGSRLAFRRRP